MSFMGMLTDLVTGGGLTTLVGGAISGVVKYKEKKLDLAHTRKQWAFELAQYKLQAASDKYLADNALLISKQQGADTILNSAIQAEAALSHSDLPWWVGAIRTLFRPWMTLFLWGALILVLIVIDPTAPDDTLIAGVVETIRQGAAATLGFWFGGRIVGSSPNR